VCACSELYFYTGVVREFGPNIGRITLAVLSLSAGMFISSTAFLPSSTSMYLTLVAFGGWFRQDYKIAIFATAVSAILSWPFTAVLGFPIAVDLLFFRRKLALFVTWSVFSAVCILGPVLACDTYYYGKPVFASLNIVLYNVFTEHGPDLYGTEPASFYLLNGLLNFNVMFPAALVALPLPYLIKLLFKDMDLPTRGNTLTLFISQSALYLWLAVFWSRPHKEERFLFPVYPLLALAAAVTVDTVQRAWNHLISRHRQRHYLSTTAWLSGIPILILGLLSVSRGVALYQHYHGSMDVWMRVAELKTPRETTLVCVGKEWHRFPSSFFLPSTEFRLGFLQSEFRGQLPKYYETPKNGTLPTMLTHADFNELNNEETGRYVDVRKCHYLVDLDSDEVTPRQPRYIAQPDWQLVAEFPFLDPSASHPLFRAFFIPVLDDKYCKYNKYVLLKRTRLPQ